MKEDKDYSRDLAEIRSMMERSSKFLSLSGWVGILIGNYALAAALIVYRYFGFNPTHLIDPALADNPFDQLQYVLAVAFLLILLTLATAVYFSHRNAKKRKEKLWTPASRHLVVSLVIPMAAGGLLLLILMTKGLVGLLAPMSLIFYGLALLNAAKFSYDELKMLGIIQIGLGLAGTHFVEQGLLLWAIGFGLVHIIYGVYMHFNYGR